MMDEPTTFTVKASTLNAVMDAAMAALVLLDGCTALGDKKIISNRLTTALNDLMVEIRGDKEKGVCYGSGQLGISDEDVKEAVARTKEYAARLTEKASKDKVQ